MFDEINKYSLYNEKTYRNKGILLLLFLIWPFGVFLYALYNYNRKESKVILVLFTALLAYSMIPVSKGLDLYRVLHDFPGYSRLSFSDFKGSIGNLYSDSSDNGSVDIYRPLITFLVSRFTDNGKWLMFSFGIITGFVFTKVLSLFYFKEYNKKICNYVLIITFSFIIGLDQLSGVRFCLAAFVFFYGAINAIHKKGNRFIIIASISILIHYSFLPIVLILILYVFLKLNKYPAIVYSILILSFVLPKLFGNFILQSSAFLGEGIETRAEMYSNLLSELNYGSEASWYVRDRIKLMLFFFYFVLLITRLKKNSLNYSDHSNVLFLFTLIVLSYVNFTISIPHLGYRFQFIFLLFAVFYLYKVFNENYQSSWISNLVLFSFPFSSLMIVYSLRSILYITPLSLYFFNLPGIIIYNPSQSVWVELFQ